MSRFSSEPVQIDWLSMDVGVVKRCMCPEKTAVKGWRDAEQQTALVLAKRSHLISGQHVTHTIIILAANLRFVSRLT